MNTNEIRKRDYLPAQQHSEDNNALMELEIIEGDEITRRQD
jgi:hypothetical protein